MPPLPGLRPDGWDCHSPADVKDHAPQDITIGTPLLYQKPPEWAENVLAKSEALRNFRAKICHSIQLLLNIRLRCGRNRISPDDRREEPRSGRYAGCGFAADKVKRADGTSASAGATKKNAPQRKVGSRRRVRGANAGERRDSGSRDATPSANEARRRYPADEAS